MDVSLKKNEALLYSPRHMGCIRVKRFLYIMIVLLLAGMSSQQAQASISVVGSPNVKRGQTKVEARIGFNKDNDGSSADQRLRSRLQIDHGFNDLYAGRISFSTDKRKNSHMEAEGLTIENRFHLLKRADYGFDFGTRLNYNHRDGDKKPDTVSFRLYTRVPVNQWDLRFNQLLDREVGQMQTPGIRLNTEMQATYPIASRHRLGFETFNNFGKLHKLHGGWSSQNHTCGPVLKGSITKNNLEYEIGYRAGISRAAPDHSVKLVLGKAF